MTLLLAVLLALDPIAQAMLAKTRIPYSVKVGKPKSWAHCRRRGEPDFCERRMESFASMITRSARDWGVDPWTLAAMAYQESRFNPAATGSSGERGILQLHPSRASARRLRFFRDPKKRKSCLREPGACQAEIISLGASILARSIHICGSEDGGLAMYNAGRCDHPRGQRYAKLVLKWRRRLKAEVNLG